MVQGKLIALNLGMDEPGKTGTEVIEIGREMAGVLAVAIHQSHCTPRSRSCSKVRASRLNVQAQLANKASELETLLIRFRTI
jgi:hypothetical protein